MNRRLERIFSMIEPGRGLIDVGTDHGYLPVQLALEGYPGRLFASDIREGPLAAAKRSATQYGVSDRIRFLLCDGLADCPPEEVDTIVIAGMGGDAICGILDHAEWCMDAAYRLILQPMTKPGVLRYWLINNGFALKKEALVSDGGVVYQIIEAVYRGINEKMGDAELYVGKAFPKEKDLYRELVDDQLRRIERRLCGLESAGLPDGRQIREQERLKAEFLALRSACHDKGQGHI